MIERLVTDRSQRVAVVLDFFETIVPMSDLSYMGEADKANLVAMQRWASIPDCWEATTWSCSSPSICLTFIVGWSGAHSWPP